MGPAGSCGVCIQSAYELEADISPIETNAGLRKAELIIEQEGNINQRFEDATKHDWRVLQIMHPAVFISASVLIGLLFSLQEWVSMQRTGMHASIPLVASAWAFHFFLWGAICWSIWALLSRQAMEAGLRGILGGFLPLSIAVSAAEEMVFLFVFSNLPLNHPHLGYWRRVAMYLESEFLDNMVIFWCAFVLFRGVYYYQRYREHEQAAAQLEVQLANARLSALRMQLNPHFLFNAMNSISSLMRIDVDAADRMLEQLSLLMRITLERGEAQFVTIREEMEFIETYLSMQAQRYAGRVEQSVMVAPELYDALLPSMLLQPIVENAFVHGLSKITTNGMLGIEMKREGKHVEIKIVNSRADGRVSTAQRTGNYGLGLRNVKSRLQLHYGGEAAFAMGETASNLMEVNLRVPLQFSTAATRPAAKGMLR